MKRITWDWVRHWQRTSYLLAVAVAVGLLLIYKLGSLTHGLSDHELQLQYQDASWHHLVNDPLFLPLRLVRWIVFTIIPHHGATVSRLPSVLFGILTLAAFAYILRRWYGVRTALYGSALFICSAWFLHVSRYGGYEISYLWSVPTILALQLLWERSSNRLAVRCLVPLTLGLLCYIPGVIWMVLIAVLLQPRKIRDGWDKLETGAARILPIVLLVVTFIPLIWAFINHPSLLQTWAGLPQQFDSPVIMLKRLGLTLTYLVYRGPLQPETWLDRIPVLGVFGIVSLLVGTLFYARHIAAQRSLQLLALFIGGAVLFALHGPVSYSLLIPLIYLVITGGIGFLLREWLHVFPRNPLARSLGIGLLGIVLALACVYNLRAYFIAWPHNTATHVAFHHR